MKELRYKFSSMEEIIKKVLDEEDINIFGYTMEKEIIHLVYLLKNGDLIYRTFSNGNWTRAQIGKFDIKSNIYSQLEVLYINERLNIIYTYSHYINSNIFTLHHVVYKDSMESRYNIVRYISKKFSTSFTADYDSNGNIHVMYSTIINNLSCIYYTYFNPFSNTWLKNPIKMSEDEKHNENPFLKVDSLNNIHAIWWEQNPNTYVLKYHRRSSSGKDIYKWVEIKDLKIKTSIPKGVLNEENGLLHLIYGDELNFCFYDSSDFGLTWRLVDERLESTFEEIELKDVKTELKVEEKDIDETIIQNEITVDEETIYCIKYEELINHQNESKILLNNILEELIFIRSKILEIEENSKKDSFIKRFFS